MNIFQKIAETVGEVMSYSQGYDAGEEWKENGGGPVDDVGFTDAAGYCSDDEEEEAGSEDEGEEPASSEGETSTSSGFLWGLFG